MTASQFGRSEPMKFESRMGNNMWNRSYAAVLLLVFFAVLTGRGVAQLSTASISGSVKDSTGSNVTNAIIKLQNVATSVETNTTSNGSGSYGIVSITPGQYVLEVTAPGFSTQRIAEFSLTVGQSATFDFSLAIGEVTSIVNVVNTTP